ncbi:MAG TPA: hypothetical protein VFC63_06035 [Blastocatellia bacterium]|nr:hypothetical protein [Blastocatellia bacterium]
MSAKITVILFIFVCFSTGALLAWLPWTSLWDDNFFLNYIVGHTGWSSLIPFVLSGYVRGAITGLGIVNILIGFLEVMHFGHSVRSLQEDDVRS